MTADAHDLRRHLQRLKDLRGRGAEPPARLKELKAWQARRLESTYADVAGRVLNLLPHGGEPVRELF